MIHERLQNLPARERATEKGREIAKIGAVSRTQRAGYDIEIVTTNAVDGGVEVFARAWKDGKQIGFGKDGSVDIERFRIFNPPILVDDPQGTIFREDTDELTGEQQVRKLREDPQEATLQVLEHNLSVMRNIHGDGRIVRGRVGRTTSTFFPAAGANTPVDGHHQNCCGAWSTMRSASSSSSVSSTLDRLLIRVFQTSTAGEFGIERSMSLFDVSSLGGEIINSATASLTQFDANHAANDTRSYTVGVEATPAATNSLATSDYDQYGTTDWTSQVRHENYVSGYNDYTLNSAGIAALESAISGAGIFKLGWREGHDKENAAPPNGANDIEGVQVRSADTSGTSSDPKLVVEHEPNVITPNVLSAAFSLPAPTIIGEALATVNALIATFSTPAPSVFGGALVQPSVLTLSVSIQSPTVVIEDTTAFPSPVSAVFSLPAPTATGGATISPAKLAAAFSTPAPTINFGVALIPSPLSLTFVLPTPKKVGPIFTKIEKNDATYTKVAENTTTFTKVAKG